MTTDRSANGGGAARPRAPPPPPRHLASLSKMKPPFVPQEGYHRFSSRGESNDQVAAEGIIVKTPLVKRKGRTYHDEVEWSNRVSTPGCSDIASRPMRTPESGKGVRGRSKNTKNNRAGPQTPMSNAGESWILCPNFKFWKLLIHI